MKKFIMLLFLCLLVNEVTSGKIKNGYEVGIEKAQRALLNLQQILEKDHQETQASQKLSFAKKKQIKSSITWLQEYMVCYQLTERLLMEFRLVAPDLYHEIDIITDRNGRPTDVYVKFTPEDKMPPGVVGTTNISQSAADDNAYFSEYGDYTVSVKIAIQHRSLKLLAHELGHVSFQVPNLLSYLQFYNKQHSLSKSKLRGHNSKDPSGKQAILYEQRLKDAYQNYVNHAGNKVISPVAMLESIRTSISKQ